MLQKHIVIILICFICDIGFSQISKPLVFDHYGRKEGFVAKSSRGILKGSDGHMYITTEYGLAKYDGHQFQYFRSDVKDTTTFDNNYLVEIAEDNYKTLWVRAGDHLNTFDISTKKVRRHYKLNNIKNYPYNVEDIYFDKSTLTTWIAADDGLYYNNTKNLSIKKYAKLNPISRIMDIDGDGKGGLWMATGLGLIYLNTHTGQSSLHQFKTLKHTNKDESQLISVHVDPNNTIWAGSWGYGFYELNLNNKTESRHNFSTNGHQAVSKLFTSQNPLFKNQLLLGTVQGFYIYDTKTKISKPYKNNFFEDIYGISGATWDFHEDKNNFLWMCSNDGLHKLDFNKQFISKNEVSKIKSYESNDGPRGTAIETDSTTLWLYYSYGGMVRYDYPSKKQIPIPKPLQKYFKYEVDIFNIYIDSKNILYIFTTQYGLVAFDLKSNKFLWGDKTYFFEPRSWVISAAEDVSQNKIYYATYKGLYQYDKSKNLMKEVKAFNDNIDALCSKVLSTIKCGEDGKLIILHGDHLDNRCLTSYDTKTNKIVSLTEKTNLAAKEDVTFMGKDSFFVTGYQGAYVALLNDHAIEFTNKQYNQLANLNNGGMCTLDKYGNVWGSEAFGVYYYNIKNNFFRNITTYNSSIGVQTRPSIMYLEKHNDLLVFQKYGFDIIKGNEMISNQKSTISLLEIVISGKKYNKNSLPKSIEFDNYDLTFRYSLLDYHNSNDHGYYTMLVGAEKDWQYSNTGSKAYSKLAPGEYTFKVKGISSNGVPSQNIESIDFTIKPPFYYSWWFLLSCFSALGFGLYAIFRYREMQRQKLEAIRLQIARDLHDDLGSNLSNIKLMSELEVAKADKKDALVYEDIAKQTTDALGNMSDIVWAINPKNDELPLIIEKIKQLCIEILEKKDIDIKFDIQLPQAKSKLSLESRRHYYLVMKEIINNCSKYSKAFNVVLKIYTDGAMFITQFEDDGCGFDSKVVKNGNGLKNIQDRIKLLKGSAELTSNIENGTKYKITIPLS